MHHSDVVKTTKLTVDDLKEMVKRFKALIKERTKSEFPQDPWKLIVGRGAAITLCSVRG